MSRTLLLLLISVTFFALSCKKNETGTSSAKVIFKFKFDSTQVRLNNIGQPSTIPAGNAAQSGVMNKMSAHYIEIAPGPLTLLGKGAVLYHAAETTAGGSKAIDFEKAPQAGNNEVFYEVPINQIAIGEYEWLRISLAYQNGDVKIRVDTSINGVSINQDRTATIASFIGFNSYIKSFTVKTQSIPVNGNRTQGFWGLETSVPVLGTNIPITQNGQAPAGATTVVNPLFNTSPIPAGSCVVTAAFANGKLKITGNETKDIVVECSFSINKSVEWKDLNPNGKWEPLKGETLVDMGIRGLIPTIK
ncbi:hypothetical protein WG954_01835 [Lacibacter sp. H375]|uniref:hypothetical protein n=1 Tax=Lacibacter sp. H375 TaxID=3133424 RepID=UPI0030C16125